MSAYYDEPDDEPYMPPVVVERKVCWWCNKPFLGPADESERFCSEDCDLEWCRKSQDDMDEAIAEIYRSEGKQNKCDWCGDNMPSFRADSLCEQCRREANDYDYPTYEDY